MIDSKWSKAGVAAIAILLACMQLGSSATYVGFGIVVVTAGLFLYHLGDVRAALVKLAVATKVFWIVLLSFVAVAVLVMICHRVENPRSWGELKWVLFIPPFVILAIAVLKPSEGSLRDRLGSWLLYFFLGVTLFSGFAAIYQFATDTDPFRDFLGQAKTVNLARGHGLIRNPVTFGKLMGGLGIICVSGVLVAWALRNRWWLIVSTLATMSCAVSVITSQARGTWLALCVVGVVGIFVVPKIFRKFWIGGASVCFVAGLLAILFVPSLQARFRTFFEDNQARSNQTRLEQWHINWEILKENPLGVGFDGNDLREDYWYDKLGYEKIVEGHCHNEFIEIAVATGWLGIGCYLFLTGFMLVIAVSALRKIEVGRYPVLVLGLMASVFTQVFLNMAVMTDQMDTQARMLMSLSWGIALAGWFIVERSEFEEQ